MQAGCRSEFGYRQHPGRFYFPDAATCFFSSKFHFQIW